MEGTKEKQFANGEQRKDFIMKKIAALISVFVLTLTLTACGSKEESGITNIPLATDAPEVLTTTTATEPPVEEEETGYIASTTREELVKGMLNALGSHDEKTFCRYFQPSSKLPTYASDLYENFHKGFCKGLSDNGLDYKAEYSYKDFEIYISSADTDDLTETKKARVNIFSPLIPNLHILMTIEFDFDTETYYFPLIFISNEIVGKTEQYQCSKEHFASRGLTPYTETEGGTENE